MFWLDLVGLWFRFLFFVMSKIELRHILLDFVSIDMFDNDRTGIFCYLSILENEGKSNVKRAEVEKKVTTDFSSDCETGFD